MPKTKFLASFVASGGDDWLPKEGDEGPICRCGRTVPCPGKLPGIIGVDYYPQRILQDLQVAGIFEHHVS
ncbi:hypothetical protein TomTYG45_10920 [Sphingobium sp. TomTYG45]